jgi:hypothetical protein
MFLQTFPPRAIDARSPMPGLGIIRSDCRVRATISR